MMTTAFWTRSSDVSLKEEVRRRTRSRKLHRLRIKAERKISGIQIKWLNVVFLFSILPVSCPMSLVMKPKGGWSATPLPCQSNK
jgi:hypothetical protein